MPNTNAFDASASALGYIYQVRYALLLSLERIGQVDDPDNCFISIEKLDDIAFDDGADPIELLQTKYHGSPGNLTDRSPDFWKTIRIWSEYISSSEMNFEEADFTLLTTESLAEGSLASKLGVDDRRDVGFALESMRNISSETTNAANISAYQAFSSLESWQQEKLLNSIYLVGNTPKILEVPELIKRQLRLTVSSPHIDSFVIRLEGLWFNRVIEVLSSDSQREIGISELVAMIDDLRAQFLPGNLPSDYDEVEPDDIDIASDDRVFVEQLRLIGASERVIRNAIVNYYRACEQRSRWSRESLVKPGELRQYLNRLKDEWEQQSSLIEMSYDYSQEQQKITAGQSLYKECQTNQAIPIRNDFKSPYVARGSYHSLSDEKVIGWHPDFRELMQDDQGQGVA